MLQSTWMDLVLGVDIHIMLVPTPVGPVPTPLPHPFTGLVLDPMGAAMNAAMGGGVVLVNGLFVTNCGTGVMNIPPHLPVPGPFAKGIPENDAELWVGALNVSMGGSLAVRLSLAGIDTICVARPETVGIIALAGLVVAALLTEPWLTLVGICVVYLLLIPIGIIAYARVRRRRARQDGGGQSAAGEAQAGPPPAA